MSNNTNSISIIDKNASISIYQHHFDSNGFWKIRENKLPQLPLFPRAQLPQSILKKNNNNKKFISSSSDSSNCSIDYLKYNNKDLVNVYQEDYNNTCLPWLGLSISEQKYNPNHHQCKRFDSRYKTLDNNWRINFYSSDRRGI